MKVKTLSSFLLTTIFFLPHLLFAQKSDLKSQLESITRQVDGITGVAIKDLQGKETIILNADHKFPMLSAFKFPVAMAVLDQVDKGKLSLNQKYHLTKEDVQLKTYSPLRDKYPDGNVDLTVADLLASMVSLSDNIACDILFKLAGGTKPVQDYVHGLGVKDIAIVANEEQMGQDWNVQYTNWCKPGAMLQLLEIFHKGKNLSKTSQDFLSKIMIDGPTGMNRIKGQLPKDAIVAHKTGTSGTNDKGMMAAVNDVGIVKMPNGKSFAIVLFVSNSTADLKAIESVMAQVSKAAFEHYASK
ncbi:class A beta-lactamase, subclass A2 [Dyadobacter sp. LJ53]|uniref:class A beta-lactamase, subclass A2 n=1 Tax=Dyadobacter chenwenxiniae TaxID=2906456 RepID=UPI001EFEF39B|nr:class A beta-lactamase, subclass A2 [Dyadobacter chenwenxiniae]MCF0049850.1 class A beta-lactamase, subclass A2 [Dyadobacter chenwenxiniae]MCF0049928.1 class A beta-lactamase, subclass A2 [Dyadobacter chenwenxiniae]